MILCFCNWCQDSCSQLLLQSEWGSCQFSPQPAFLQPQATKPCFRCFCLHQQQVIFQGFAFLIYNKNIKYYISMMCLELLKSVFPGIFGRCQDWRLHSHLLIFVIIILKLVLFNLKFFCFLDQMMYLSGSNQVGYDRSMIRIPHVCLHEFFDRPSCCTPSKCHIMRLFQEQI